MVVPGRRVGGSHLVRIRVRVGRVHVERSAEPRLGLEVGPGADRDLGFDLALGGHVQPVVDHHAAGGEQRRIGRVGDSQVEGARDAAPAADQVVGVGALDDDVALLDRLAAAGLADADSLADTHRGGGIALRVEVGRLGRAPVDAVAVSVRTDRLRVAKRLGPVADALVGDAAIGRRVQLVEAVESRVECGVGRRQRAVAAPLVLGGVL